MFSHLSIQFLENSHPCQKSPIVKSFFNYSNWRHPSQQWMYSFFFHLDTFEYINSLTKLMINFGLRHFSFYMEAEVKSLKMRTTEECIDVRKASLLFSESSELPTKAEFLCCHSFTKILIFFGHSFLQSWKIKSLKFL